MPNMPLEPAAMSLDPKAVAIGDRFVAMLTENAAFRDGVTGGKVESLGDSPVIRPIVYVGEDGRTPDPDPTALNVVPLNYDEERGAFIATYAVIGPVTTAVSSVDVKGFLVGDVPVIENVRSHTDDTATRHLGGLDTTVYEASVRDGVVTEQETLRNPTEAVSMDVGMAGGRLYDLSSNAGRMIDASAMDPIALKDLAEALDASEFGIVTLDARTMSSVGFGMRVVDYDVTDENPQYDVDSLEYARLDRLRDDVSTARFDEGLITSVVAQNESFLTLAAAGLRDEGEAFATPTILLGADIEASDYGTRSMIEIPLAPGDAVDASLRPTSAKAYFRNEPEGASVLTSFDLLAERFVEKDGRLFKSHDVKSSLGEDGKVSVTESRPDRVAVLSAQAGRLYAVVDDQMAGVEGVRVSEVRDVLEGAPLKDTLKSVTSMDGVYEWTVPFVGEIGEGPVSVGAIASKEANYAYRVDASRLKEIDRAVALHRIENGHVAGGIIAQAGSVGHDVGMSSSKGRDRDEGPGIMDRMKALFGGRDGR